MEFILLFKARPLPQRTQNTYHLVSRVNGLPRRQVVRIETMDALRRFCLVWLQVVGSLVLVGAALLVSTPTLLLWCIAPPAFAFRRPGARRRTRPPPKMPVQFAAKRLSKELQKVCDIPPSSSRLELSFSRFWRPCFSRAPARTHASCLLTA